MAHLLVLQASPMQAGLSACLLLCLHMPGLHVEELSLKVRPGAPHHIQLLPGHPWEPQVGPFRLPCWLSVHE